MDRTKLTEFIKMKKAPILLVFLFCLSPFLGKAQEYKLTVKVTNQLTNSALENAEISISPCNNCGGVTNKNGVFTINLPENNYTIWVNYIGFKEYSRNIKLQKNLDLAIILTEQQEQLSEVIVRAKRTYDNIESPQMGVVQLSTQDLIKLPTALGEIDVLKGLTLMAGVNNAGDISNGLSVRGGSLDQNLLLYDYAPVFNPTHLFGIFSVFTPEVLSSVDLYRANIPSRYGGRVASVLDVKVKNPYVNKLKLSGGIGFVSSRLAVETPIIKDKLMLIAGARVGLTDFLLPIFSDRLKNTKAKFGDATVKLLYLPTEKDQLSFTGFYSKDFYQLDIISTVQNINAENNQYDFGMLNGTLNWIHSFNDKTNLKTVVVNSSYTPKIIFPEVDVDNEIEFSSKINYLSLISELSTRVNDKLDYHVGIQANEYKIDQGNLDPGSAANVTAVSLNTETGYELSGYANANWKPNDYLSISAGLRYNQFLFLGPFTDTVFDESGENILSEVSYEKGEVVETYNSLEPRFGATLKVGENTSFKASYARVNQYLQNIYNSTTPIPTSRWKTADVNIKPQVGDTYGVGMYQNFNNDAIEMGLEAYYRTTDNVLTYKPGADFFLEENIEQDIVQGEGEAYGVELSFRKPEGKINGWFNYTWSRSFIRSNNENLRDRINNNQWFPSDFDRPHVLNGTINFEGDKYNTFSFNFTGQTGRPFSVPNGFVSFEGIEIPVFFERNNSRLPVYHRLDLSWNVHFSKSKVNKRWSNDWTFTIYNVYGRKNPVNIYYTQRTEGQTSPIFQDSPLGSFELSILNSPLISVTYNFKFQ